MSTESKKEVTIYRPSPHYKCLHNIWMAPLLPERNSLIALHLGKRNLAQKTKWLFQGKTLI